MQQPQNNQDTNGKDCKAGEDFSFYTNLAPSQNDNLPPQRYNTELYDLNFCAKKRYVCPAFARRHNNHPHTSLINFSLVNAISPIANHIKKSRSYSLGDMVTGFFVHADYMGGKIHCKPAALIHFFFLLPLPAERTVSAPPEYAASALWEKTA